MPETIENKNTVKPEVLIDECVFSAGGGTELFALAGETEKDNIRLTLYDGSITKHWYWGNLAFELSTMRLAKPRIPILDAHDTDRPLGYSVSVNFDGQFLLEGKFLKNNLLAAQRKSELNEGFPFEASLRFDPSKTKIELIREGESTEVNGRTLRGPGAVMRKAVIMEGSMCVFGALNNCKTENFENVLERFSERKQKMTTDKEVITLESFEKDSPEIFKQIIDKGRADGEKSEREYFAKLMEVCGDDHGLLVEMHTNGKTPEEAMTERNKRLVEANKQLAEQLEKGKKVPVTDPAQLEFTDSQAAQPAAIDAGNKTDDDLKKDFAASKDLQAEFGSEAAYIAYVKAENNGQVNIGKKSE